MQFQDIKQHIISPAKGIFEQLVRYVFSGGIAFVVFLIEFLFVAGFPGGCPTGSNSVIPLRAGGEEKQQGEYPSDYARFRGFYDSFLPKDCMAHLACSMGFRYCPV